MLFLESLFGNFDNLVDIIVVSVVVRNPYMLDLYSRYLNLYYLIKEIT